MRLLIFTFLLIIPSAAVAQGPLLDQVLIPVYVAQPTPGAHGSLWQTDILVHNPTSTSVQQAPCPGWLGGFWPVHEPHATKVPLVGFSAIPATFVCSEARLDWYLRVRDLSRQALSWGTEIPVIRQQDLREQIVLIGVPTDERFRQTLRVYSWRAEKDPVFAIRVLAEDGTVILERNLEAALPIQSYPGYAELVDIVVQHPELTTFERVTLSITATTAAGPEPLWAFVSVTNNEAQHVTLVTPD